jgi:hypothetical protein
LNQDKLIIPMPVLTASKEKVVLNEKERQGSDYSCQQALAIFKVQH